MKEASPFGGVMIWRETTQSGPGVQIVVPGLMFASRGIRGLSDSQRQVLRLPPCYVGRVRWGDLWRAHYDKLTNETIRAIATAVAETVERLNQNGFNVPEVPAAGGSDIDYLNAWDSDEWLETVGAWLKLCR